MTQKTLYRFYLREAAYYFSRRIEFMSWYFLLIAEMCRTGEEPK